jgi:birA, biotin-[acetyl-CoA-carboxylase] ligase region
MKPNNGITFIHLEETDSTNTYLKSYPKDPAQPYVAVMADYQTAGRGQRGNTWHSARGQNLLCSIRHHPTFLRPQQQFILSQLIALTITDGLSELLPDADEHLRIKWPNDIYWDDRKLCGILIEYELSATSIEQAIIGFGVNVNQTDFGSAPGDTTLRLPGRDIIGATYRPTSLRLITGKDFDVPTLFYTLTRRYITTLSTLNSQLLTLNLRYARRLYRLGTPARYRDAEGDFTATIEGVNPDGTLRLRLPDGTLRHYEFKQVAYLF